MKKQVTRTYDDFGRKLSETDQNGKTWKWTWNLHNQLVSSQTPVQIAAGQSTAYAYGIKTNPGETQGQLKQRSVPGAQTAVYTRDALGFVTKAETKNGANQTVVAYSYAYDPAKRLASVTDSRGNKQLSYSWTPGGRLALVEDSDGHQASMSYDATGRLASVVAPNGETVSFVYDAGGRLVETRLNSGQRTTQSWFEDGNLKQKQNLFNTTVLTSHLYTIDNQGRRSGQTEVIAGTSKSWSYLYDNLDRITTASDGTAETYSYDIYGNRRSKTKGTTTTAYLYDAAHQLIEIRDGSDTGTLTGAAVHDADGHMVKLCETGTVTKTTTDCTATGTGATTLALVWNALDHLNTATRTGVGAVAESYQYDDSGRRIQKTSGAITTRYLYDGDAIHAEWNGAISGNPAAAYVHGAGIDEPLLRLTGTTNSPAATEAAYLQDGLGSVVGTTNASGTLTANQRFDAWGNKTTSSGTIPQYGYTGREPDQTGLTFYRARHYHPGIARFASRDPMGMADAVSGYAYVGNDPVNYTDPTGEFGIAGAVGSVLLGGVIRGFSGEDIFDARAIATDAVLGAVGAGIASKASRIYQGVKAGVKGSPQFAKYIGNIGEQAGGATGRKSAVDSLSGTAARRFPDKIDDVARTVNEVKNKAVISAKDARQINDDVLFAGSQPGGYQAQILTRRSTDVSRVQGLIDNGSVVHKFLPGVADDGFRLLSPLESGLVGAGFGQGTQSLYDFATGISLSPYSGGMQTGLNPRDGK